MAEPYALNNSMENLLETVEICKTGPEKAQEMESLRIDNRPLSNTTAYFLSIVHQSQQSFSM